MGKGGDGGGWGVRRCDSRSEGTGRDGTGRDGDV